MPLAVISIVATSTIHPPHIRCGTNRRISTRNARRVTSNVGRSKMRRINRYRGEWEGECRCAVAARMKHIRVRSAATGCTIRIDERELRALVGREKSASVLVFPKRPSKRTIHSQSGGTTLNLQGTRVANAPLQSYRLSAAPDILRSHVLVVYPTLTPLHCVPLQ